MSLKLSDAERNSLVVENLACVHAAANSFWPLNAAVSLDDLISAGYHALVLASRRFDPGRNTSFSTFAYPQVRGAMKDILISLGRALKHHTELPELDSDPDAPERAAESLAAFVDPAPDPERKRLTTEVLDAVKKLPEPERSILRAHFLDDRPLTEVAAELGISKVTASRVLARAIAAVREKLDDRVASWPRPVPRPKNRFPPSFKAQVLRKAREAGLSVARLSRETKVPASTIHDWLKRANVREDQEQLAAAA